jgi:hypothetical protein
MSSNIVSLNEEQLLGTWHISAFEARTNDGTTWMPYTNKPQGILNYNPDGTMIVILTNPDRPLFESNDMYKGSNEEIRAAFEGFTAYCGRSVLDPEAGTLTHHLEQCLFPSWIGTQQVRFVSLEKGQLSLSTQPILADGKEWTLYLIWNR